MASSRPAVGEQELISLQIRTLATGNHDVTVAPGARVSELKALLVRPTGLPTERQRIIYSGRVLEDSVTLSAAGIADGHTLHLVEQDPSQHGAQQAQQAQQQAFDPAQLLGALLGSGGHGGGGGGGGMPSVEMQTVQLGPFDVSSQEGWQQFAATLGALGGTPPGGPAGAQPAAGAAARASPFNFGNIFGGAAAQGGRGGRGRGGRGRGGPPGPAQQQAAAWWASVQQEISRQLSGVNVSGPGSQQAHLFDGLDRLLLSMERAGDREGGGAAAVGGGHGSRRQQAPDEDTLPAIHALTEADLAAMPAQQAAAWRHAMPAWQHNCVAAARSVLESAQLSGATRVAVNRVLQAAGAEPLRLSAEGGSSLAERRIRSFPVIDDPEEEGALGSGAAGAAGAAAAAGSRRPGWRTVPPRGGAAAASAAAGTAAPQRRHEALPEVELQGEGSDDGSEWETDSGGSQAETEDGQVDDYLSEVEEGQAEGGARLAGAQGAAGGEDELPPLVRDDDGRSSSRASEAAGTGAGADDRARGRAAPRPALPHADVLLLAAVALGELIRRFLLLLGAPPPPTAAPAAGSASPFAAAWAGAERLRALTTVPTAPGRDRDELTGTIRRLAGWLCRVGAASAELMRALQYLGSGIEEGNLWMVRALPGYIAVQGGTAHAALPRAQGVQIHPTAAAAMDIVVAQHQPGAAGGNGAQHWQALQAAMSGLRGGPAAAAQQRAGAGAAGAAAGAGAAAPAGGDAARAPLAGQPVVRFTVGPPGQALPVAVPIVAVPGSPDAPGPDSGGGGDGALAMPVEMAAVAQRMLAQLGIPPASQQQLLGQFQGITQALRQSSVAALNLPEISREVGAAVQRVVSEQSAGLRSSLAAPSAAAGDGRAAAPAADPAAEAATLARQLAPAITSEVQSVLSRHLGRVRSNPLVEAFLPYLREIGIDIDAEGAAAAGAQPAGEEDAQAGAEVAATAPAAPPAAPAPAAASTPAPAATDSPAAPAEATAAESTAPSRAASATSQAAGPAAPAPVSAAGEPAPEAAASTSTAEAPSGRSSKPAPAGLGRGLLPRKPAKKAAAAAPPAPTAPAASTEHQAQQQEQQQQQQSDHLQEQAEETQAQQAQSGQQPAQAEQEQAAPAAATAARSTPRSPSGRSGSDLLSALSSQQGAIRSSGAQAGGGSGAAGAAGAGDLMALLGGGAGAGGGAAGGGGGLMYMLQGMMNSPALMEMAQSPAVQQMAEQMFSGSGGGGAGGAGGARSGGGGGLAGMMTAMAPLMGDLLGGLGGGAGSRTGTRAAPHPPASLEELLARELPAEEAARWKAAIEADEQAQQAGAAASGFSDAYLAALPPRAAAGLLQLADDDAENEDAEQRPAVPAPAQGSA